MSARLSAEDAGLERHIRAMRFTLRRLSWTTRPRRRAALLSRLAELSWELAREHPDSQLLFDQGGAFVLLAEAELNRWQGGSFPCEGWVEDSLTERDQELLAASLEPLRQIACCGPRRPALQSLNDALRPVVGGSPLPDIPVPWWCR